METVKIEVEICGICKSPSSYRSCIHTCVCCGKEHFSCCEARPTEGIGIFGHSVFGNYLCKICVERKDVREVLGKFLEKYRELYQKEKAALKLGEESK